MTNSSVDFLQALARAARQLHTYPAGSRLCTEAIEACHTAFAALEREEALTIRVGPRELHVGDEAIGRGTIVEQELWRPLHRARVASVEIEPTVSVRDWAQFCGLVSVNRRPARQMASFPELLLESGVSTIIVRATPRPELFEVGAPPAPVQAVVERERVRQASIPATGTAKHLYPPDKGWVRLDPTVSYDSISLLDLAVLINEPSELAVMLTRLIDEDASDDAARARALEHRYVDIVMLVGALDARLGRVLFSKLAHAVLALDSERRRSLLRRAILPGLLDGRLHGEAVLSEFPDMDLADALCLLLDLDAASAHVLPIALDRLHLSDDRRNTLTPLITRKLNAGPARDVPPDRWSSSGFDDVAKSLTRVTGDAKDFGGFAAFDLAMTDQTTSALASVREALVLADGCEAQLRCALSLARVEPNPSVVETVLARAMAALHRVHRGARWDTVAHFVLQLEQTATELDAARPDVAAAAREAIVRLCDRDFMLHLAQLARTNRDDAAVIINAVGVSLVPGWLALFDEPSDRPRARQLVPLMCDRAPIVAAALAARLPGLGVDAACAALTVLGAAGSGHEEIIAAQVDVGDERLGREAMRALARIGSRQAAGLIATQIDRGRPIVCPAAEEALWRLPRPLALARTRELLERRDFVSRHPAAAARLMERAVQCADGSFDPLLDSLMGLRFQFWRPGLARVGAKARALRQ